jgi:flavin reductase (DIM6/NTAB) family NADH-FMN oxidoreductase RutF
MALDPREYRRALAQFPTGVAIVTARGEHGRHIGLTANSFTSVSLDPALVSWSLRLSSALFETFDNARHFGVNVLAASQAALAARFAARCDDRFQGVEVVEGMEGLPLIAGSLATFECSSVACHVAGDHGIFIGRVERYTNTGRAELPLVFCQGGYTAPRELLDARREAQ